MGFGPRGCLQVLGELRALQLGVGGCRGGLEEAMPRVATGRRESVLSGRGWGNELSCSSGDHCTGRCPIRLLSDPQVWDVVEEHDPGCTAGSGRDRFAVFKDAGLDLKISTGMYTPASSGARTARARELWEGNAASRHLVPDGHVPQPTAELGRKPREGLGRERQVHPQPHPPRARRSHLPRAKFSLRVSISLSIK